VIEEEDEGERDGKREREGVIVGERKEGKGINVGDIANSAYQSLTSISILRWGGSGPSHSYAVTNSTKRADMEGSLASQMGDEETVTF
jgi:hypothetical protein